MPTQTPTVNNTLDATITTIDINTGEEYISKSNGVPSVPSLTGQLTQRFKTLAAGFDTQLPISVGGAGVNGGSQIYIKNVDTNALITVKWNLGAGVVTVATLPPGGMIILWNVVVGGDVNQVSVASSVGGTFVECFQGVISE